MPNHPSSEKDEALNRLLHSWKLEAPLPPRFQEAVWNRISQSEKAKPAGHWGRFSDWVEAWFARPRFALSYVAILLLVGLAAGAWRAHGRAVQDHTDWGARYVQMVDPYLMPRH